MSCLYSFDVLPRSVARGLSVLIFLGSGVAGSMAVACPDWQLTGQRLSNSSDQLTTPQVLSVIAGGSDTLNNCPQPGYGYVATRPDFDLSFQGNQAGRDLEFSVNASCDSVLLVNDARGQWHFDDDGGDGLNSYLRIPNAPEGAYDIWVGTYGPSTCRSTLTLRTNGGSRTMPPAPMTPPMAAACPDPDLQGQTVALRATDLARGQAFSVTAGGATNIAGCPLGFGVGYVDPRPNLTFDILDTARGAALDVSVNGTCDTVLLVSDPQGRWSFSDDSQGSLDPSLSLDQMMPGQYDVWVGTYSPTPCSAVLRASVSGVTAVPVRPQEISGPASGRLVTALAESGRDVVGRHESLSPDGRVDGVYRFAVTAPGQTVTSISIQSTNGSRSVWDTVPNAHSAALVIVNGRVMNQQDTSVSIPLGRGETIFDVFVEAGARQFGLDPMRITVGFASGATTEILVPQGYGASAPDTGSGTSATNGQPALAQPDPTLTALPSGGHLRGYRDHVGQTFRFEVTGAAGGNIWGAGIYTDDSIVARAAVHAGLLQVSQTGIVEVLILPGQAEYEASTLNGVQTSRYGTWGGSYRFVLAPAVSAPPVALGKQNRAFPVEPSAPADRND